MEAGLFSSAFAAAFKPEKGSAIPALTNDALGVTHASTPRKKSTSKKKEARVRLSKERIAEIRQRCEAATSGPWEHANDEQPPYGSIESSTGGSVCCITEHASMAARIRTGETYSHADARFIAASRSDIPDLLSEIDRLNKVVEEFVSASTAFRRMFLTLPKSVFNKVSGEMNALMDALDAAELEARKEEE